MKKRKRPGSQGILPSLGSLFKKNLPYVLTGTLTATAFLVLLPGFSGPESSILQRFVFILAVAGGYLGALVSLFTGLPGLLTGYGLCVVVALPRVLPEPWDGVAAIFCPLAMICAAPLWVLYGKRKRQGPKSSREPDLLEPGEPSGSVFVIHDFSGRVYQLVRTAGQLRAYRVGGELRGLYAGRQVDPADPRPPEKGDLIFPLDSIRAVTVKEHQLYGTTVRLRGRKSISFNPYWDTTPHALEDFLRRALPATVMPAPEEPDKTPRFVRFRQRLRRTRLGLLIALAAVNLPWMFLDVPYKLFSGLSLLLFCVLLTFTIGHRRDITFDDTRKKSRVDMGMPLILAGMVPALRSLADFNYLRFSQFLLWGGGITLVLLVLLLAAVPRARENLNQILVALMICLFMGMGAAGQLNCLLDSAVPTQTPGVITDMHISTSDKSPDWYYLDVLLPDGSQLDLKTHEEHYRSLEVGDTLTVYTFPGGLGIAHALVK